MTTRNNWKERGANETVVDKPASQGKWQAVAAVTDGADHLKSGTPCQDAADKVVTASGALIAAVSDGAGSSSHSDDGAWMAAEMFTVEAERLIEQGYDLRHAVEEAFKNARRAVFDLAEREGGDAQDYAATLLAIVCAEGSAVAAQVGDGAIIADGKVLIEPDTGEYANETRFITSRSSDPNIVVLNGTVNRLTMITDGLQNIALDYNGEYPKPHSPFFEPLFGWLSAQDDNDTAKAQLLEFLESPRVRERTHDDLTLLLAMRSVA